MSNETKLPDWMVAAYLKGHADLIAKAQTLVDLMNDVERNHGGLTRPYTLRARDELALELAKWK